MKVLTAPTLHAQTDFWLEEFATPYFIFRDAGAELTLASPKVGPIDPKRGMPKNQTPEMARFAEDADA